MSLKITPFHVGRKDWRAQLGDVTGYGATAAEAKADCEGRVLAALVWRQNVVEVTPTAVLVAFDRLGSYGYDAYDSTTGFRRCSTSTGDTFAEAVESMRRHADEYRAAALVQS